MQNLFVLYTDFVDLQLTQHPDQKAELVLQVGYITRVQKFMVAYDSAVSK